MQTVDRRATEKQFHRKLDISRREKFLKHHSRYFENQLKYFYGGIAQQRTNLSPGQAASYLRNVTVQKQ